MSFFGFGDGDGTSLDTGSGSTGPAAPVATSGGAKQQDNSSGGLLDIVKTVAPLASSSGGLCKSACGDAKDKQQQQDNINQQHPLTGDPATDAQIKAQRDAAFQAWQTADDVQKFKNLPPQMQALLPAAKAFVDQTAALLPPEAMDMTVDQAAAKYPDVANKVWASLQQVFPSLKGMPLSYALTLADASGFGSQKLGDIKKRVDNLSAAVQSQGGVSSGSGTTLAIGGFAIFAVILGALALKKKK